MSTHKISIKTEKYQLELSKSNSIEKQYIGELFNNAFQKSSEYVPLKNFINLAEDDIKLIAFYLPQFHPIPENDKWWGKGFTEWTNVTKAVPQFIGHYQPHLPDELGFYDLRLVEVQKRQIELAKQYGIYGFCFHYYWFNGKKLLEKPLNQFIQNPEMGFPFCVCWANENWTRRWDGLENKILIAQTHSPESDFAFIKDLEHIFRDPRYIRINGRPLLVVYRVSLLPDTKETANRWREYCKQKGIGDLYLVAVQSFDIIDPRKYGFDAAVEFPPHTIHGFCEHINHKLKILNPNFSGHILDYEHFVKNKYYLKTVPYKLFKAIMPGWDNTARRPNAPTIYHGSNPELYKEWLSDIVNFTRKTHGKEEQIVFINAWNEWSEGTHLEPDKKYGYGYLQATSEVVLDYRKKERGYKKIIFVSHDAHLHGAQMLALNIIKLLTEQFHYDVHLILKSGGCLENEFKKYSTVYNLEKDYVNKEALEKLVDNLHKQGADVAICNTVVTGNLVKIFTKRNIKTISLIHELPELIKKYKMEKNAEIISQSADKVIFASEFVKTKFATISKLDDNNCIIAPQGLFLKNKFKNKKEEARILLRNMLSIPQDAKIILCVGYADYRKGVDLFVKVAKNVVKVDPKTYFVWVGHHDENFMNKINSDIKKSGIKDNILFVGIKKEGRDVFYAGADLYLMTSREDPFPSVILEAMDVEVPVIGFNDAGGFKDIVTDSTGNLVPYLDVDEMSKKVIFLLNNVDLRDEMGKNASELINEKYKFVDYVYLLLKLLGHEYKKVSVVLPNYNYEHYLKERMQSILNQEYPIYEIIFLDDCSSDNSIDVITDFVNNCAINVEIISNEVNSGSVFKQWAKGIAKAGGDYIWIAEADDLCEKTFLYEVMSGFNDERVVLSYSQSKQMDQNGNIIDNDYLKYTNDIDEYKWKNDYSREGIQEIRDTLVIKNTIPNVSGVVFKKYDILEMLNKLVEFKVAGDWFFYVWLLQKGKISYTAKPLNLHRRHDKGVTLSENTQKHYNEIVRMQDYIIKNFNISDDTIKKVFRYRQYIRGYLLGNCSKTSVEEMHHPGNANPLTPYDQYKSLNDDQWFESIRHPKKDSLSELFIPKYPSEEIQRNFTGLSGIYTLNQAFEFYKIVKEYIIRINNETDISNQKILDFGCGWGRIIRFFLKDIQSHNIYGSDCIKQMIDLCKETNKYCTFFVNDIYPPLTIESNFFNVLYAYSVFSHISENAHRQWLEELYRILKPNGLLIVTTRKMEFIDQLNHIYPRIYFNREKAKIEYQKGNFVHMPVGGGYNLSDSYWGEAMISRKYIDREWTKLFTIVDFIETGIYVDQNIIIAIKK